jgi:hypothetical protein
VTGRTPEPVHEDYAEMAHIGLKFSAGELDASAECEHGSLPGDRTIRCACWKRAA